MEEFVESLTVSKVDPFLPQKNSFPEVLSRRDRDDCRLGAACWRTVIEQVPKERIKTYMREKDKSLLYVPAVPAL